MFFIVEICRKIFLIRGNENYWQKVELFRQKTIEELDEILNDPNSTESDIIIASFEKADKEELGIAIHYTIEEVLEHIFGKSRMVGNC